MILQIRHTLGHREFRFKAKNSGTKGPLVCSRQRNGMVITTHEIKLPSIRRLRTHSSGKK